MAKAADASAPVRYETLRRLAVGGMGEIFLAREYGRLGFSRLVVIKRMLPQLAGKRDFVDMFVDEARIVGHLNHPNICQILQLGEEDGVPFLALEYVRGDSLSAIWDRALSVGRPVSRAVTLRLLTDTAWALHFAHEAVDADGQPLNVIHRDISPHNVMVSFQGDVKLMDFGIARADNRAHRTDTGKVKGKVAYMAPEQLRGEMLDRRADVFAVGVMLWELTLSRRLFGGGGEVETLKKAVACDVPRPRSIDPDYPEALERIVMAALAPDRARRTPTAGELAQALQTQLASLGGAERADIAAFMRDLFPDESKAPEDALPTTHYDSSPTDLEPLAGPRPTVPLRTPDVDVRPTTPLHVARPEPSRTETPRPTVPLRASAPEVDVIQRPSAPVRRASRTILIALIAIAIAAVGGWAIATRPWVATSPTPATPAPQSTALAAPAATRSEPAPTPPRDVTPDRGSAPAVEAEPEPAVATSSATVSDHRASSPKHPAHATKSSVASATAQQPAAAEKHAAEPPHQPPPPPAETPSMVPAATPSPGVLAVASDQIAIVSIDGVRRKSTPFQTSLPAGDHVVELELAEGAGTLRATAHVTAGTKTKCRVDGGKLACAASAH